MPPVTAQAPTHRIPYQEPLAQAADELQRLRAEVIDLRLIVRGQLTTSGARIETKRLFALLFTALTDDERKDLIGELQIRFCLACGAERAQLATWCRCQMGDDVVEPEYGGEG